MVFTDICVCVFQGMLVEGPPGPEGPTVSQSSNLSPFNSYLFFLSL